MIASISFKAVLFHHLTLYPAQQLLPEKFHYSLWGVLKQVKQVVNDFGQRRDALWVTVYSMTGNIFLSYPSVGLFFSFVFRWYKIVFWQDFVPSLRRWICDENNAKYPFPVKFKETRGHMIFVKQCSSGTDSGLGISHSFAVNHQRALHSRKTQICLQDTTVCTS